LRDVIDVEDPTGSAPGLVALFIVLLIGYAIIFYFNCALAGAVLMHFDGQEPTLGDGLRIAAERRWSILGYAVIAATVGLVFSVLRERLGNAGRLISWIGDIAWGLATFFVVPILVTRKIGPIAAIRESGALFRRTWGEQVVGQAGVGVFGFVLLLGAAIVGGAIVLLTAVTGVTALLIVGIAIAAIVIGAALAAAAALGSVYRVALYRYATGASTAGPFQPDALRAAFAPKQRRGGFI
jgi:hypothetical protein